MNWLFGWTGSLFHSLVWKTVFATFEWVDWATVAFLILGIIYGLRKGFMREFAEIAEVVVVTFLTLHYYPHFAIVFHSILPKIPLTINELIVFILTASIISILMILADQYMRKWVHTEMIAPLKLTGGAILGVIHFALIWSLISQVIALVPTRQVHMVYEAGNSYSGKKIIGIAPRIHQSLQHLGELISK